MQVDRAFAVFDEDGSGALDFREFVNMMCKSEEFKFKLTNAQKAELQDAMMVKVVVEGLPAGTGSKELPAEMKAELAGAIAAKAESGELAIGASEPAAVEAPAETEAIDATEAVDATGVTEMTEGEVDEPVVDLAALADQTSPTIANALGFVEVFRAACAYQHDLSDIGLSELTMSLLIALMSPRSSSGRQMPMAMALWSHPSLLVS